MKQPMVDFVNKVPKFNNVQTCMFAFDASRTLADSEAIFSFHHLSFSHTLFECQEQTRELCQRYLINEPVGNVKRPGKSYPKTCFPQKI